MKMPKSLAACADLLYQTQQKRYDLNKQVKELEKIESELKTHLIDNLPKSDASGIAGKLARVTIVPKVKPVVEDWDAFYKHVKKTGHFDLLQRRLSDPAVNERWDDGKEIPGVGKFNAITVSLNKV